MLNVKEEMKLNLLEELERVLENEYEIILSNNNKVEFFYDEVLCKVTILKNTYVLDIFTKEDNVEFNLIYDKENESEVMLVSLIYTLNNVSKVYKDMKELECFNKNMFSLSDECFKFILDNHLVVEVSFSYDDTCVYVYDLNEDMYIKKVKVVYEDLYYEDVKSKLLELL